MPQNSGQNKTTTFPSPSVAVNRKTGKRSVIEEITVTPHPEHIAPVPGQRITGRPRIPIIRGAPRRVVPQYNIPPGAMGGLPTTYDATLGATGTPTDAFAPLKGLNAESVDPTAYTDLPDEPLAGVQFGLPAGDPNTTLRGQFAQFMGGPIGQGAILAANAIPEVGAGLIAGGPVGGVIAGAGSLLTGGAIMGAASQANDDSWVAQAAREAGVPDDWIRGATDAANSVLSAFGLPAQYLEQGIGYGAQVGEGLLGGDLSLITNEQKRNAALEAAKLTYEATPIDVRQAGKNLLYGLSGPTALYGLLTGEMKSPFEDQSKMFVDYDMGEVVGGLNAIGEARQRIMAGEDPELVIGDISSRFGAPGQIRNLLAQMVADPLNVAGPAGRETVGGIGRVTKNADLIKAVEKVRAVGGGPLDAWQAYSEILKTQRIVGDGVRTTKNLSLLERMAIGRELLDVVDGQYKKPHWWEFGRATPASMATERVNQANNTLQSHLGNIPLDDNYAANVAAQLDRMTGARLDNLQNLDPASRAMLTVEGNIVQRQLQHNGGWWRKLAADYEAGQPAAKLIDSIAQTLGGNRQEMIARIANATDETEIVRLFTEAGGDIGTTTPAELKGWAKKFLTGDIPHTPEMARAKVFANMIQNSAQWARDFFRVEPPALIQRVGLTIKALQSPLLLGLNPGYLVNNILNNEITMLARGIYGFNNVADDVNMLKRMGLNPGRIAEGVGAADELAALGRHGHDWGSLDGMRQVMKEAQTVAGPLDSINQAAGKIGKLAPITNLAAKYEQFSSVRAFTSAFREMWANTWQVGKGFDRLPDAVENALREIDPRLPDHIYAATQLGGTPAEIAKAVLDNAPTPTVQRFTRNVADKLGMDVDTVSRLLDNHGLSDQINKLLLDGEYTPQRVAEVFHQARVEATSHIAERVAEEASARMDYASQVAGNNGTGLIDGGSVLMAWDDMRGKFRDTFTSWKRLLENHWEDYRAKRINGDELSRRLREDGDRLYGDYFKLRESTYKGLTDGLKKSGISLDEGFTANIQKQHTLAQDFNAERRQALNDYFHPKTPYATEEARALAWEKTQALIRDRYAYLDMATDELQAAVDRYMAAAYEAKFPGSGAKVSDWLGLVRKHESEYRDAVSAQFERVKNLGSDVKSRVWREFDQTWLQKWGQYVQDETAARQAAFEFVPGRANLEAGVQLRLGENPTPEELRRIDEEASKIRSSLEPLLTPEQRANLVKESDLSPLDNLARSTPDPALDDLKQATADLRQSTKPKPTYTAQEIEQRLANVTADQLDLADLKEGGWTRGATAMMYAVNKDRGLVGLSPYRDLSEIPANEALAAINRRGLGRGEAIPVEDYYNVRPQPTLEESVAGLVEPDVAEWEVPPVDRDAENVVMSARRILARITSDRWDVAQYPELGKNPKQVTDALRKIIDADGVVSGKKGKTLQRIEELLAADLAESGRPGVIAEAVTVTPRHELPEPLSEAIAQWATELLRRVSDGQPGERIFVEGAGDNYETKVMGIASTYPEWYGPLKRNKKTVEAALKKIIKDKGADVDKGQSTIIAELKSVIWKHMVEGDQYGMPPEPEILRWAGYPDEAIDAAYDAWINMEGHPLVDEFANMGQGIPKTTNAPVDVVPEELPAVAEPEPVAVPEPEPLPDIQPEDVPAMTPPGVMAQAQPMPIGSASTEVFNDTRPILDELQAQMMADAKLPGVRGGKDLDPALRGEVQKWVSGLDGKMAEAKLMATKWGEYKRDGALLNYGRRYQYNNALGVFAPYEFWMTQSMMKWAQAAVNTPAWFANYYRIKEFLEKQVQTPGYPTRLAGKVKIPIPFMPEWMGGGVYVDPLKIGLPLSNFGAPWENYSEAQARIDDRVRRYLETAAGRGEITPQQYQAALQSQDETWQAAESEVLKADPSLRNDGMDFVTNLLPPSLPLKWAYEYLRGTPERIGPLPITRDVKTLTAALDIGGPGGVNLEEGVRRVLNLPVFDQWDDYRIDRELASMAAEGLLSADDARLAMMNRSGPYYDMAVKRQTLQKTMGTDGPAGVLGWMFGKVLPYDVVTEGEDRQRQLRDLYSAAADARDNGDPKSLSKFFDKYPAYEARLALYDDPDERVRNFLIDHIWTAYMDLPSVYKSQWGDGAGPVWRQNFIDKATRSYDNIPTETLAAWARTLGSVVPKSAQGPLMPIEWADPQTALAVQAFYDLRDQTFDMETVNLVQGRYFELPKSARSAFLASNPELKAYWDWRRGYLAQHPTVQSFLDEKKTSQTTTTNSVGGAQPEQRQAPTIDASPETIALVEAYLFAGRPLPPTLADRLRTAHRLYGQGQKFETWLVKTLARGGRLTP